MFELIILLVFIWLLVGVIRLTAKVAWGATKVVATILMVLALGLTTGWFLQLLG